MMKKIIQTSIVILILYTVLYIGLAAAHGKVDLEQDNCVRGTEGSRVHFSTYQPQFDSDAQYCTDIPKVGNTYWVVDLIDQALRDMPVGVEIVKGGGDALSEVVASFSPTSHPDGVIKGESNLDEGLYTVLITGKDVVPPVHYAYPLRVHMINYVDAFQAAVLPVIALLLLVLFMNKYLKSRRVQH
tara:strand:- start:2163 stop:2720 length:558 start_codon:yes stop_codon:yes gene_type:complete